MDLSVIISFIGVSMLLTLSPGPDILFVVAQSVSNGKKAGIATSLGLCSGLLFHTTAAALGLSVVIQKSVLLFSIFKYAGAAYLIYLAIKAFKEGKIVEQNSSLPKISLWNLYKKGILMNVLNPKVGLFFLAFLPQFIRVKETNVQVQMIYLGFIFICQAIIIFTLVSALSGTFGDKVLKMSKVNRVINYLKAIIFVALGLKIAFSE